MDYGDTGLVLVVSAEGAAVKPLWDEHGLSVLRSGDVWMDSHKWYI